MIYKTRKLGAYGPLFNGPQRKRRALHGTCAGDCGCGGKCAKPAATLGGYFRTVARRRGLGDTGEDLSNVLDGSSLDFSGGGGFAPSASDILGSSFDLSGFSAPSASDAIATVNAGITPGSFADPNSSDTPLGWSSSLWSLFQDASGNQDPNVTPLTAAEFAANQQNSALAYLSSILSGKPAAGGGSGPGGSISAGSKPASAGNPAACGPGFTPDTRPASSTYGQCINPANGALAPGTSFSRALNTPVPTPFGPVSTGVVAAVALAVFGGIVLSKKKGRR